MPAVEHRQHNGLSNRAENSHQPTRRGAPAEALQTSVAVPTLSVHPRPDQQPVSASSSPPSSRPVSGRPHPSPSDLGRDQRGCCCCVATKGIGPQGGRVRVGSKPHKSTISPTEFHGRIEKLPTNTTKFSCTFRPFDSDRSERAQAKEPPFVMTLWTCSAASWPRRRLLPSD